MDYLKISADDHIDLGYLPADTWLARTPSALKDRVPQIVERDGGQFWVCGDEVWSEYRSAEWFARPGRNPLALDRGGVAEEGRPVTTAKRLEDMDRDRVEYSLMFPPIVSLNVTDYALASAILQGYNDWAADFADTSERLGSVAILPPNNPELAKDELLRVAKEGRIMQAGFLVNDVTFEMYQPDWDPFWDAANDSGIIISYHAGGSIQTDTMRAMQAGNVYSKERRPVFGMGLGNGGVAWFNQFVGLFTYGILEKRPNLRFVAAESGIGWIPNVVQEMDLRWERLFEADTGSRAAKDVPLKQRPSDLFKRQVWATYQTDPVGLHLTEFFGDGHIMWASDYPHHDSTWPYSQEVVDRETAHLDPATTRAVVRDNAAALYGIPNN